MLKNKQNNLDNRREFYIYRVVRNGQIYDEDEVELKKSDTKVKTATTTTPQASKKVISYAESFGYRVDPSRYDSLRRKNPNDVANNDLNDDSSISNVQQETTSQVEPPQIDQEIGYYDEGVVLENNDNYEEQDSYNDLVASVDEIYHDNFSEEEITYDDLYMENMPSKESIINPSQSTTIKGEADSLIKTSPTVENKPKPQMKSPQVSPEQKTNNGVNNYKPRPNDNHSQPLPTQPKNTVTTRTKKSRYIAPSLDLLTKSDSRNADNVEEAENQKEIINNTFKEAGIRAKVDSYIFGPTVTQFLISIEKGANVKDVRKVESNMLMYLQCESIRIQTPIPGKPFAGIEVPKKYENRRTVFLGDMLANKDFKNLDYEVPVAVGQDNYGIYHYIDLVEMPHGLIAGTTKSGKSVCLNAFLLSLIYRFTPDELRLVLIDPKRIELGIYDGIPHLAMPVIVDQEDFQSALGWVYDEMERRYKEFELYDEHNIVDYNKIRKENNESTMPHIIVMMDEFSDWFADANSEIELYMQKLAAKARAAGINIILATQRPSKDVIKGTIKANFDTRIAFRVSSFEDAKVILGYGGAEKLEGKGDMLIRYAGRAEQRLQGAFVPNSDIKKVTRFLKDNNTCDYIVTKEEIHQSTVARQASGAMAGRAVGRDDERFEEVAFYVVRNKNASVNQITQIFNMGFNRVNDIFLALEEMGVLSPGVKGKQREVLLDEFQLRDLLEEN